MKALSLGLPDRARSGRHSERRKFLNAVNGSIKEENSERSLILLAYSSDFDSAIRR
jgi:hypothetical protein